MFSGLRTKQARCGSLQPSIVFLGVVHLGSPWTGGQCPSFSIIHLSMILKLINKSWRENKGNHRREGGLGM